MKAYWAWKKLWGRPGLAFQTCTKLDATKYSHLFNQTNSSALTTAHHHPATGRMWLTEAIHRESWRKETRGDLFCCSETVQTQLWGTMCSLAHADNTRARFLCIFVQIGLKYLKKPSLNHFSWQKHLQADTSQLQNQYLHVWFFFPIWYFKQLNWLAGTNHCSAHWEPSFAQAPIYKSLSLSETWPILNAVKPVQAQATMLIQFQLGTTEIQLQITCVQTHWGTARESGSQFLLLCQHGLSKTIYSSQSARTFRTLNHTF